MDDETGDRYGRYFPYLESVVEVVIVDARVQAVAFSEEPDSGTDEDHELLDRIDRYLSGTVEDEFEDVEIQIDVRGADRSVYDAVRSVSYGENVTVEDIARAVEEFDVGTPEDLDDIREILDRNPIPLIIPDHRVRDGPSAAPPRVEQRLRSLEQLVS